MNRNSQNVVPRDDKWAVRKTGSDRVTRKFDTKEEAIEVAREFARNQKADLNIFGRDGWIRERISYENDSLPSPG